MGLFRSEATDRVGKVVRGVMNARDEQHVKQNLTSMGYAVRGVYASGSQAPTATTATAARASAGSSSQGMQAVTVQGVPVSVRAAVPVASLAGFFRHLSTLVNSGMSISQSLSEMGLVTRDKRLRKATLRLQETTQSGRSLSSTMAEFPDTFPVHAIASVWSGELAGKLDTALEEVASDFELEASEIRYGRFGWGLTKLHVVVAVLLLPMSNIGAMLMPALKEVMKGGKAMGPLQVLAFIGVNYVRTTFWKSLLVMAAFGAFWIALGHLKRIPAVKRVLDEMLLHAPVWGRLHRDRAMARFLHVMDGLYSAGLTPGQAWDAASLTVRNSALAERLKVARGRLPITAGIAELFTACGAFAPEEVAMAASGEKSGQVPAVLANMSAIYTDKAAAAKTKNRALSITIMLVFFGLLTLFIFYRITNSYCDFAEKAAELMGKP